MSGIVRAVHQSFTKLGDTPLARLDLFESLPSRRFGCRASTTNSTAKSRSTSLYNAPASSRGGCRALQLYSALHLYSSTVLYTLHPLHPPSDPPHTLSTRSTTTVPCRPDAGAPCKGIWRARAADGPDAPHALSPQHYISPPARRRSVARRAWQARTADSGSSLGVRRIARQEPPYCRRIS